MIWKGSLFSADRLSSHPDLSATVGPTRATPNRLFLSGRSALALGRRRTITMFPTVMKTRVVLEPRPT
jgi:hypothetical protein